MAKTRRAYTGASVETTTTSAIAASGTTTFTVSAAANWPYGSDPYYVVLSPGTASEEKVLVTRTGASDTTINIASDSERGQDGTSAVSHDTGATVYPVFTAVDADEANELASMWEAKGDIISHGTSTFARLAVGTNDYVLQADSSAASGLAWGQVATASIANDAVTNAKIAAAAVDSAELVAGAVTEAKLATDIVNRLIPAGTIAATVKSSADTGWVLMGTTISNAQNLYPSLWAVAPTNWQSGSSLVLPSMENRYLTGKSGSETLGAHEGSNDVTLTTAELPQHAHNTNSHSHGNTFALSDAGHSHSVTESNHSHSITDPNHSHAESGRVAGQVANRYLQRQSGSGSNWDFYSGAANANFESVTHPATTSASTGITGTNGATTGLTVNNQPTSGVSLSGGVSTGGGNPTQNTGSGTSFDIQGARLVVNFQIKAH